MSEKKVVGLDEYEFGAVVNIIVDKRNQMIKEQKDTEFITEILEKVINAPTKKKFNLKREREKCER